MPVLESTDRAMPRSALRHRPIERDVDQQGMTNIAPVALRASRLRTPQTEEDEQVTPGGTSAHPRPKTPRLIRAGVKRRGMLRAHPLLLLGLGMIAMLVLWTLLTLAVTWWNTTWDDLYYGRPRTFQTDAVVGHNDSAASPSHFIAINLNGRLEVIEFPGSGCAKPDKVILYRFVPGDVGFTNTISKRFDQAAMLVYDDCGVVPIRVLAIFSEISDPLTESDQLAFPITAVGQYKISWF